MIRRFIGLGLVLLMLCFAVEGVAGTRDDCVAKCKEAATYIQSAGIDAAVKEIAKNRQRFLWKEGVSYVFLMNLDGKMLAHPIDEGLMKPENLLDRQDKNGKLFIKAFVDAAKKGKGWVKYEWVVPGTNDIKPKHTFVYRVPNTDYFVAAGFYVMSPGVYY